MRTNKARRHALRKDETSSSFGARLAPFAQSNFHLLFPTQASFRYAFSCISVLFVAIWAMRYCWHISNSATAIQLQTHSKADQDSSSLPVTPLPSKQAESVAFLVSGPLSPEVGIFDDVEVFYMLPNVNITGVLIFFHGCQHSGQHLFLLPEDRLLALESLNRGLLVMSPTSVDRSSGCWSRLDIERVVRMLANFEKSINLPSSLPRMGIGASSGGAFLFDFCLRVPLKSMVSYVMGKGFEEAQLAEAKSKNLTLPATGYVHMPRDAWTSESVSRNIAALQAANIPTYEWRVYSRPFLPDWLCNERLIEWKTDRCKVFFDLIKVHNPPLLNPTDSVVLESYTTGDWDHILHQSNVDDLDVSIKPGFTLPTDNLSANGHSWLWAFLEEEIAVSFAVHEMTAEYKEEVLDFLMAHAGINL